jgi:hypothetical protein
MYFWKKIMPKTPVCKVKTKISMFKLMIVRVYRGLFAGRASSSAINAEDMAMCTIPHPEQCTLDINRFLVITRMVNNQACRLHHRL